MGAGSRWKSMEAAHPPRTLARGYRLGLVCPGKSTDEQIPYHLPRTTEQTSSGIFREERNKSIVGTEIKGPPSLRSGSKGRARGAEAAAFFEKIGSQFFNKFFNRIMPGWYRLVISAFDVN
ncbi:hypothetical protein K0M31_017186 [Melipona bicolor]|uniref:Uncharacterized protein n=1 Tax=Melipona bicolor TaxID=60889 RepID=A0AA40G4C0_9HYME|nr:hypothetical protein K0M31_017186 [Melipona bicolor]